MFLLEETLPLTVSGRSVLSASDFTYLGSFRVPSLVNGLQTSYSSNGIAMRRVNGNKQFFHGQQNGGGNIYEMSYPGLTTSAPWPKATFLRNWNIYQGKATSTQPNNVFKYGLFWDEHRLWWTFGNSYAGNTVDNCFGWTDLSVNPEVAHGAWGVHGGNSFWHSCQGGVLRVPQWFANQYLGGKTLALGMGGYYSIVASGTSEGPSLHALADPLDASAGQQQTCTPLVNYYNQGGQLPGRKAIRNANYFNGVDPQGGANNGPVSWDINPVSGQGYWTCGDWIWGAGCWVDTPTKSGMVFFPRMISGTYSYWTLNQDAIGSVKWAGTECEIWIYDPADLGAVATGQKNAWQIDATKQAFTVPLWRKESRPTGCVFDPVDSVLYLMVQSNIQGSGGLQDPAGTYPMVHAYQVS